MGPVITDALLFNALDKGSIAKIVSLNLEELPVKISDELISFVVDLEWT